MGQGTSSVFPAAALIFLLFILVYSSSTRPRLRKEHAHLSRHKSLRIFFLLFAAGLTSCLELLWLVRLTPCATQQAGMTYSFKNELQVAALGDTAIRPPLGIIQS